MNTREGPIIRERDRLFVNGMNAEPSAALTRRFAVYGKNKARSCQALSIIVNLLLTTIFLLADV
jgi:hypothetical protein